MVKEKEMRSKSLKARTIITVLSAIGLLFISIIAPITVLAEDNVSVSTVNALQQAVEGAVNQMWTITALQMHPKGIIVADEAACAELKVGTYNYFKDIEKDNLCPCSLLK